MAQGLWLPNPELAQMLRDDEFDDDNFDQNFSQNELAWNRGASQDDEYELKELYLDIELLDSRLWLRIGKQNIVWGKTELFRTTDQFNPQDLALGSLTSLEESRIGLWALRAVWSFYNVGPLEDLRLELAMNYDEFEPTDLGRCGEPYAPLPVCDKTWGLMAHGFVADAVAGEIRPPDPWDSWKGIEVGGRLEWRYDRFSFAVTDFYGFNDMPYVDPIFSYSRNVDPISGRPRRGMDTGPCRNGSERSCLTGDYFSTNPAGAERASHRGNSLTDHSVNQTQFAFICATSIGFNDLDPTACGQTIYNSRNVVEVPNPTGLEPRIMIAVTSVLSGQCIGFGSIVPSAGVPWSTLWAASMPTPARLLSSFPFVLRTTANAGPLPTPLVPLGTDHSDGTLLVVPASMEPGFGAWTTAGLQRFTTPEQQAILGCGPFYGTQCDLDGIDLMNMEASAQTMSWPIFEGTFGAATRLLATDASVRQPGTVGYQGGPVCTRFENGRTYILPGCRGPGDLGYNEDQDGTTDGPDAFFGPH